MNSMNVFRKVLVACVLLVAAAAFAQPADPCDIQPGDFCTYTQGGWGADCNGNNPGCLLQNNFTTVFPGGITIGGAFTATFTSSAAVNAFLPAGGTPDIFIQNYTNPTSTSAGVFAGQLLAATINIAFVDSGIGNGGNFDSLYYNCGLFDGWSLTDVMALANEVIGGNLAALPAGITVSDLSDALASFNEGFDECDVADTCFVNSENCGLEGCPEVVPMPVNIGDHFCLTICDSAVVYWCCPFAGGPVFSWVPGCNSENTFCDEDCTPLAGNVFWTAHFDSAGSGDCAGGWWSATFTASDTGCICVFFETQLPVELQNFTAMPENGRVRLDWMTASERNNDHFNLQRSVDGRSWITVARVNGQGTVSSATQYSYTDETVTNGVSYSYRLMAADMQGNVNQAGDVVTAVPTALGATPHEFALHQNYPNPFNPTTEIRFDIAEASHVSLTVFDLNGRVVATLVNNNLAPNTYSVAFDATGLASGTYFYRLQAGSFTALHKMLILK